MHFLPRFQTVLGLALLGLIAGGQSARTQDEPAPRRIRESVSLETNGAAAKRLATVEQLLAERQWNQAVDTLLQVAAANGDALIAVGPGRYVNVHGHCAALLADLPAEGLAVYRNRVDAQAERWLEEGRTSLSDAPLLRIVERAFVSSFGDDALWLLGERAWERGDAGLARDYWTRLLPKRPGDGPAFRTGNRQYPDTGIRHADIHARLVLCSIVAGDETRSERELAGFRAAYSTEEGTIGGRTGRLANLLEAIAADARQWPARNESRQVATFAVDAARNAPLPQPIDVGGRHWSAPLASGRYDLPARRPALIDRGPLSYFPVVFGDLVLLNDAERIYAWNVRTGAPAWPRFGDDSAVIYPAGAAPPADPPQRIVGVPRFTMTVHEGRLYARMGSPVTGPSSSDLLRAPENRIVCLNLARGEGKPEWEIAPDRVMHGEEGWSFEGSPVAAGSRLYVALRRRQPQTQLDVACLDAETGAPLWTRKVCTAVADVPEGQNLVSHHLLTLGGELLYYSTDSGAVAALDAADGTLQWVVTYESRRPENPAVLSDHTHVGLTPCLYHDGLVIAAPNDSDELLALDAATGVLRWRQHFRGGVRHLLGVAHNTLIVSGDRLWGLDMFNGRVASEKDRPPRWPIGSENPAGFGYGRGIIAGERICWPRREDILVVDLQGRVRRRVELKPFGLTGGNLIAAGDHLLIAQPDQLVALWPHGHVVEKEPREFSAFRGGLGDANVPD